MTARTDAAQRVEELETQVEHLRRLCRFQDEAVKQLHAGLLAAAAREHELRDALEAIYDRKD